MMPYGFRDTDEAMRGVGIGVVLCAIVFVNGFFEGNISMMTVTVILAVAAFICTLLSTFSWCPLWIAVILLCVLELLRALPPGH